MVESTAELHESRIHEQIAALRARKPGFSERHPAVYPAAVAANRLRRRLRWLRTDIAWAAERRLDPLPVKIIKHKSLLLRQLGESEMYLQHNKVRNLQLATAHVDGLLLRPGESFSFNRIIGNCTRRRGYVEGMRLSHGAVVPGVGGGICQLANLLHWMVLHSELTVTERSEHSVDPFPDNGRVLPWGVGCSIVYNYVDLQFRNDTDTTYQLLVNVGDAYLEGELRALDRPSTSFHVYAEHERFYSVANTYYRANEIWRSVIDRRTGQRLNEEHVRSNCALVKYLPAGVEIRSLDG